MKSYAPKTLKEVIQELEIIDKDMAMYMKKFSQNCYESGMSSCNKIYNPEGPLDFFYWGCSFRFSFEDFEKRNKQLNKIFKKKKKAELNKLTKKIDYAGCNPEIAKFLKKHGGKRGILCKNRSGSEDYVVAYCKDLVFPYRTKKGAFGSAVISSSPKKAKKIKKSIEIMKVLIDEGYEVDEGGDWTHDEKCWFVKGMWIYAGTDDFGGYNWQPNWLVDA